MSKRIVFITIIIILSFGLSPAYGFDGKNEKVSVLQKIKNAYNNFRNRQQQKSQVVKNEVSEEPPISKVQSETKEATKEEMLAELKEDLAYNDEVFDAVPELKAGTGQNGNVVYTYNNAVLDGLSKEDLAKLYSRVRQALVKIRTERIQRQLETIRQAERLPKTVNSPQSPPRVPAAPPSVPKAPPSPPSVPNRR
ncbi:MAG: hypothetical protein WC482_00215 [Candidatus Omnitrophota bacterium]